MQLTSTGHRWVERCREGTYVTLQNTQISTIEITQIRTYKKNEYNTYIANLTEITDLCKLHRDVCLLSILQAVKRQSISPHNNPFKVSGSRPSPSSSSLSKEHKVAPAAEATTCMRCSSLSACVYCIAVLSQCSDFVATP
jgi:hypothetical protein